MVVHCLFDPSNTWTLRLSSNENTIDQTDSIRFIEDAAIEIFDELGETYSQFQYLGNGIYKSPFDFPEPGMKYSLRIKHKEYPAVTAASRVPEKADFQVIDHELLLIEDEPVKLFGIDYIEGPALTDNLRLVVDNQLKRYYEVDGDTLLVEEEDILQHVENMEYADVFLPEGSIANILCFHHLTSSASLEFRSFLGFRAVDDAKLVYGESSITLSHASSEYYDFARSLELYRVTKNNFVSSIVPPVEIYSNVEGGLGIFAARNKIVYNYSF